jgi:RNA polymerase sigma-70 factor (ECF subfamily)
MSVDESPSPDQLFPRGRVVPDGAPEDLDVVRRVRSGDVESFAILVRRYEKPVYNAVRRMVRNREDARDLAQNAFLKAFRELDSFDERYRFFSWLYRIALHEALNHLRGSGRSEPLPVERSDPSPGPEGDAAARQRSRLLEDALTRLSPDHRMVILLRHFGKFSYAEIGDALGLPEKTVRSRLFEARRSLRSMLVDLGVVR